MIDLRIKKESRLRTAKRCKEKGIIIPTLKEQKNPALVKEEIKNELKNIGLWDVHPRNLFRITWKNEPVKKGGLFDGVNYIEIPSSLSNVNARIIGIVGKWFPTGAHKVGATFGCLVPRLVTGQFDPTIHKAVWPSTGNYCRGGAYTSTLLNCKSIAILPEGMSKERFEFLKKLSSEIIKTPGSESNVKEIFDKCNEMRKKRKDIIIFNQFDEFGNHLWHYSVTGNSIMELYEKIKGENGRIFGIMASSGSSGTLGCGDFLKEKYPWIKIAVGEALQCPTLILNGFGEHRIEGIGDKHIPWIHNVKNTDIVLGIDDEDTIRILRLFNEEKGKEYLEEMGVPLGIVESLELLGISSIGNLIGSIKIAKYFNLKKNDIIFTVFTDSMELYRSRINELREERGIYKKEDAIKDFELLKNIKTDWTIELDYYGRKRIHNLKYYTWVEQQGKNVKELIRQWEDDSYWDEIHKLEDKIDELIVEFNEIVEKV
uniref:Pyridoxal-phosphate dependent enzyme n=1 Tax=candidate division WOR-3 bacterium TaxID=2052148 RepID=A0A7C4Y471_UNCW3